MKQKKIAVFLYNSFKDPVIQSNLFLYLKHTGQHSDKYHFHIISFEQTAFSIEANEKSAILSEMETMHMNWTPLSFTPGGIVNKVKDFIKLVGVLVRLRLQGYKYLITLNSVAGAIGYLFALCLGMRLYMYQYEPHSEYGLDAKLWDEKSIRFKILHKLEYLSAKFATVISSGTVYMMDRLKDWNVQAQVFKIPSVVNEERFMYTTAGRLQIREKFNIPQNAPLVLYPGKFGDLYYSIQEVATVFSVIHQHIPEARFMVLTMNDLTEVKTVMVDAGLTEELLTITRAAYEDMPSFLSAADLGVVAVPPDPSKKFCSNIKVGEFLCTGLPYLICEGVSEDDIVARKFNVGIPVKDFSITSINDAIPQMNALFSEEKSTVVNRCRPAGSDYRGFNKLIIEFGKALDALTK